MGRLPTLLEDGSLKFESNSVFSKIINFQVLGMGASSLLGNSSSKFENEVDVYVSYKTCLLSVLPEIQATSQSYLKFRQLLQELLVFLFGQLLDGFPF